jgi:hypothetical protein
MQLALYGLIISVGAVREPPLPRKNEFQSRLGVGSILFIP